MSFPVTVPQNNIFALGDNRQHSGDSRTRGFVSLNRVKGKAFFRVYPVEVFGAVK